MASVENSNFKITFNNNKNTNEYLEGMSQNHKQISFLHTDGINTSVNSMKYIRKK